MTDLILAFIEAEMSIIEADGFYSGAELERWHRLKNLLPNVGGNLAAREG